ncbi:zf-HC2 domain-containing protein [Paenibacillus contaminans]|jgi:anti-sigma factor RsiW|uniref:Anti-sigma-W factor RsiW n=1 Tax=Paenibacillus contaminans TaxID=450362 RepID=A0A329M7W0_9BACL|nr:zf-HC2 domain-containing protein [Paenibacillus contaminans]MDF2726319.1 anti-sigma factor [Paenibacillus sp.]RAV15286.1 anti-sigma factor [Paenibacillus contaminans]
MNCKEALPLMHDYLDGDLTSSEATALKRHMLTCQDCRARFQQLERTEALVKTLPRSHAPDELTARIISSLPQPKRRKMWMHWVKRHPAISVASVFLLVMLSSFATFWDQDTDMMVKVSHLDEVVIKGDTVYVPAGRSVNGDLLVQRGKVEVEGEVKGNLIVIDGTYNLASTAHIAGKIKPIDQTIEWVWYKVNEWVSSVAK